MMPVSLL